jgi:hypothetical protein
MAAKVEKTSGLPLPNARKVTPAMLSLNPRRDEIVLRLTQKKSLAAIPMVLKSRDSHRVRIMNVRGLRSGRRQ